MTTQLLLAQADDYRTRIQAFGPLSPEIRRTLDETFRTAAVASGNALEGGPPALSEKKASPENGSLSVDRLNRSRPAEPGYSKAYDAMLYAARKGGPVTEDLILGLHKQLYEDIDCDSAGSYRTLPMPVSETGHRPPDPEDIPRLMTHFIQQMEYSKDQFHPIEFAALSHKRLIDIQPFASGNGSLALLFLDLLLIRSGYSGALISPALQPVYTQALAAAGKPDFPDIEPLISLIAECVVEAEKLTADLLNVP